MRNWPVFASAIRKIVTSAAVIVEVLEAVLGADTRTLRMIVKENPGNTEALRKLIRASKRVAKTFSGRFEIGQLIEEYTFESNWPIDDISLRRLYEIYRRGELGKRLPAVDRRIA